MSARSIVVALAALFALAPAAHAKTETATSGAITATLSYNHVQDSFEYTNMALTISRAGVQVLAADPTFGDCDSPYCAPGGLGGRDSVAVRDLDGDGEPEVILDLYTGGAHCCFVSRFYRWDGASVRPRGSQLRRPGLQDRGPRRRRRRWS